MSIGRRRRRALACTAAFGACASLSACGAADAARDPDTLVILTMGDERVLGPQWDMATRFLAFLPLAEESEDGTLRGVLARGWEHSPDYLEWTIPLRSDVRWHDGTPFTANDVKFSLDFEDRQEVEAGLEPRREVTVLDDTTYVARYRQIPDYPVSTWNVFYPRHLLDGLDTDAFYASDFWTHPVGNGPYRYVRHVPGTLLELEANPDYFRGKPPIGRIILRFAPRDRSGLPELLRGDVDMLPWTDPVTVLKVRDDPRFRVYVGTEAYWRRGIAWNQNHPPLRDARVRRALTLALDRRELHRVLNLPDGLPLTDAIYNERLFKRRELPPPLAYDTAEAIRLLEAAGWRDTDGDGVREKDGMELRFTVPGQEPEALWVQAQLRKVGAAMDIQPVESVLRLVNRGEFEAIIGNFGVTGRAGYQAYYGEESKIRYANPRLRKLLDQVERAPDPDVQDSLYREMMPLVEADMPITMLAPQVSFVIAHRRVRGLDSIDPMYYESQIHRLWLEEGW